MGVLRFYRMMAAEGKEVVLNDALVELGRKVSPLDGSEGVELYRDPKMTNRFVFIERWASVEAHKAAGLLLGKDAFAPVAANLAEPPEGFYLDPVAI